MKKTVITLTALLGGIFLLGACTKGGNTANGSIEPGPITNTASKNAVSYQLVTSTALINDAKAVAKLAMKKAALPGVEATQTTSVVDLLGQIDLFTVNADNALTVESKVSDRVEFESLEVISYTGLDGQTTQMSMYYNSFAVQDTDLDDDDEEDRLEDQLKNKVEKDTRMEGVVVFGAVERAFLAEKEEESETGETEVELNTKIFTSDDKRSYILASRSQEEEIENGVKETEFEYEYAIVENGIVKEAFSYSIEDENGQQEVEVKVKNASYGVKMEIENGRTIFKVKDVSAGTTSFYEKTINADGTVSYTEIVK